MEALFQPEEPAKAKSKAKVKMAPSYDCAGCIKMVRRISNILQAQPSIHSAHHVPSVAKRSLAKTFCICPVLVHNPYGNPYSHV